MANRDDHDPWISSSGVFAHPDSPLGGGGPGRFSSPGPLQTDVLIQAAIDNGIPGCFSGPVLPHPRSPAARTVIASNTGTSPLLGATALPSGARHKLKLAGYVKAGGPLNNATIDALNLLISRPTEKVKDWTGHRFYIAYETQVKVGGDLAWRFNNPGNLRSAPTEIGKAPGDVGLFAVFATMEDGRAAQRSQYLTGSPPDDRINNLRKHQGGNYKDMTVREAVEQMTPKDKNDAPGFLKWLEAQGVKLGEKVQSQQVPIKKLTNRIYGNMTVQDAVLWLTPPADQNNTPQYLKDLAAQGVDLDKEVKIQIDLLMTAIKHNEASHPEGEVVDRQ